ncbi:MAG TPA: hypothetical protein VKV23_09685 [Acidimicrobiales bacterium]|nr:hypothetical protein [Acidimicrobiales bacterium]
MIVRILGDSQYELPDAERDALEVLDLELDAAIREGDEDHFEKALAAAIEAVRATGTELPPSRIVPSELVLPPPGADLEEVRRLLETEASDVQDG